MTVNEATCKAKTKKKSDFDIDLNELNLTSKTLFPYLEHRIKILTISDTFLRPGVEKTIPTNLIILKKNIRKNVHLQLKSAFKLPIKFLSEKIEIINDRLFVKIQNHNNFNIKICIKSPIAYLFVQPSILIQN